MFLRIVQFCIQTLGAVVKSDAAPLKLIRNRLSKAAMEGRKCTQ